MIFCCCVICFCLRFVCNAISSKRAQFSQHCVEKIRQTERKKERAYALSLSHSFMQKSWLWRCCGIYPFQFGDDHRKSQILVVWLHTTQSQSREGRRDDPLVEGRWWRRCHYRPDGYPESHRFRQDLVWLAGLLWWWYYAYDKEGKALIVAILGKRVQWTHGFYGILLKFFFNQKTRHTNQQWSSKNGIKID